MTTWFAVIVAIVIGWMIQLYVTYRQSVAFNASVRTLRRAGLVSVGMGGRRYRGGRAIVALAVDTSGTVRDTLCLSGWTTFARGKPLSPLIGVGVERVRGDEQFASLSKAQREAARQAADLMGEKWREPMS
jgi:DNA-binding transcriptional regulator of glucitol operon